MPHPIIDHLKRFRVRWAVAAGVAVVAVGLTAFAVKGATHKAPAVDGPRLSIAVVAPKEPKVQPGDVMDVGALNDGFDGHLPEQAGHSPDMDLYAEQPTYVEDEGVTRSDSRRSADYRDGRYDDDRYRDDRSGYDDRRAQDAAYDRRGDRDEPRGRPMAFGFDRQQPDWRAEREARWAAMAEREARLREDEARYRYRTRSAYEGDGRY